MGKYRPFMVSSLEAKDELYGNAIKVFTKAEDVMKQSDVKAMKGVSMAAKAVRDEFDKDLNAVQVLTCLESALESIDNPSESLSTFQVEMCQRTLEQFGLEMDVRDAPSAKYALEEVKMHISTKSSGNNGIVSKLGALIKSVVSFKPYFSDSGVRDFHAALLKITDQGKRDKIARLAEQFFCAKSIPEASKNMSATLEGFERIVTLIVSVLGFAPKYWIELDEYGRDVDAPAPKPDYGSQFPLLWSRFKDQGVTTYTTSPVLGRLVEVYMNVNVPFESIRIDIRTKKDDTPSTAHVSDAEYKEAAKLVAKALDLIRAKTKVLEGMGMDALYETVKKRVLGDAGGAYSQYVKSTNEKRANETMHGMVDQTHAYTDMLHFVHLINEWAEKAVDVIK